MSRIAATFTALRAAGRKGLVGYLTAGDPDLTASLRHFRRAAELGVDVLEIGIPFSDPTADGPTIQAAGQRALAAGTTVAGVLELVRQLRRDIQTPIVLFGYVNPLFAYGFENVCRDAADAGADGLLVVDLPAEEAAELRQFAAPRGLDLIPLIAPTTPIDRARTILAEASGFVYYIMVTGVTGTRAALPHDVAEHVKVLRTCTGLPIAAGFGVSSGEQAAAAARHADAVVVGSALVEAAAKGRLDEFVRELRRALG